MAKRRPSPRHAFVSGTLAATKAMLAAELKAMGRDEANVWVRELLTRLDNDEDDDEDQRRTYAMLVGVLTVMLEGIQDGEEPTHAE